MTTLIMTADKLGLESVSKFFAALNAKRLHSKAVRITIKQLSALSDRELNDMGISRGDIYSIAHGHTDNTRSNTNLKGWV